MRPTNIDRERFGEPRMRVGLSPLNRGGINADDMVEITEGERAGQRGLIFFRSAGGRAFIQFGDDTEGLFNESQYRDPPSERLNAQQIADGIQKIRARLNL